MDVIKNKIDIITYLTYYIVGTPNASPIATP